MAAGNDRITSSIWALPRRSGRTLARSTACPKAAPIHTNRSGTRVFSLRSRTRPSSLIFFSTSNNVDNFDIGPASCDLEARKDIRIVFTDIDMPGSMDGLKLARAIRDRWPPIEFILTSGHFDVPEGDIPERGLFFSKPYHDNEIVSALRRDLLLNIANSAF
jgi:CheY-like chemotaxis protein